VIVYRQATQADAPAVLSLLEEIMEHHAVAPPESSRLAATVDGIIAAPDHCFLVAEREGSDATRRLIGMCALVFSLSTWSASPVCELQDVVVTEEHRREDVGCGLIAAAEEIARGRGCSRLFLLAESWNLGAHSFYRSQGMLEKTCLYFERDLQQEGRDF
jgi:N-acetylglutamate synthase-like GNAT family acetyltransferase